jgi:CheY-like chemotaxis protein
MFRNFKIINSDSVEQHLDRWGRPKTILVVEDNPGNIKMLEESLIPNLKEYNIFILEDSRLVLETLDNKFNGVEIGYLVVDGDLGIDRPEGTEVLLMTTDKYPDVVVIANSKDTILNKLMIEYGADFAVDKDPKKIISYIKERK